MPDPDPPPTATGNLLARALIRLGRLYQRTLSYVLPTRCRFFPSCSQYFVEAVEVHGAWRGLWLTTCRLLRCQPLSRRSGYDPVPDRRPSKPRAPD